MNLFTQKYKLLNNGVRIIKKSLIQIPVRNYRPRRALMYVPGCDLNKINKIPNLNADAIALDCEDGVAFKKKEDARIIIRDNLKNIISSTKSDIGVRLNSIDSGFCEKDMEICLSGQCLPHTILLPKVDESSQLLWFSDKLNSVVKSSHKFNLIMYIESPKAFIHLRDICNTALELSKKSSFVPTSLVFGSDDFCASLGASRTDDSSEILYARQKLVLYAKAFNMQAIDMVYIKYKDLEGLRYQCEQGMKMGYTGKQVIHPMQLDIVQDSFLPTLATIEWAEGLLNAFEEHQAVGKGAFTYKGAMIDMPTMKQAQNVIESISSTKKST